MVNTPIPHSLRSESLKAAKILQDFTMPSAKSGPDKIIPAGILVKAEGLAIITVVKIGFLVTARAGSGIVIARLGPRRWSSPSAIGIAGLGGGFEIGAEVTDFVIILNRKSALDAFSKGGNLTLGGNFTIAAGPLGRNIEGDVAIRSPAAIYTYSKTKGLFAGISIEGSCLIERKDANKKFYGMDVRACEILAGNVEALTQCQELHAVLERHEDMFDKVFEAKARQSAARGTRVTRSFITREQHSTRVKTSSSSVPHKSASSSDLSRDPYNSNYQGSWAEGDELDESDTAPSRGRTTRSGSMSHSSQKSSMKLSSSFDADKQHHKSAVRASTNKPDWDSVPHCKALWSYKGQLPCDLSFTAGDVIEIRTRTHTQDDWWEGMTVDGHVGIFPANYVQLL